MPKPILEGHLNAAGLKVAIVVSRSDKVRADRARRPLDFSQYC